MPQVGDLVVAVLSLGLSFIWAFVWGLFSVWVLASVAALENLFIEARGVSFRGLGAGGAVLRGHAAGCTVLYLTPEATRSISRDCRLAGKVVITCGPAMMVLSMSVLLILLVSVCLEYR